MIRPNRVGLWAKASAISTQRPPCHSFFYPFGLRSMCEYLLKTALYLKREVNDKTQQSRSVGDSLGVFIFNVCGNGIDQISSLIETCTERKLWRAMMELGLAQLSLHSIIKRLQYLDTDNRYPFPANRSGAGVRYKLCESIAKSHQHLRFLLPHLEKAFGTPACNQRPPTSFTKLTGR